MNKFVFDKKYFEDSFSIPRMNPYWIRYCGNEKKAILHYKQNIQLAEALLPAISIFEVALRNAVIKELERMTMRKDWCTYFASMPALKDQIVQLIPPEDLAPYVSR